MSSNRRAGGVASFVQVSSVSAPISRSQCAPRTRWSWPSASTSSSHVRRSGGCVIRLPLLVLWSRLAGGRAADEAVDVAALVELAHPRRIDDPFRGEPAGALVALRHLVEHELDAA